MNVGFIGIGVMGRAMAKHLMNDGHQLFVFNRTKEKTNELVTDGAIWCETPSQVVKASEIIFTMLGYPIDVEEMYLGEGGLLDSSRAGQLMVDCTTSSPNLAEKIAKVALTKHVHVLDAPVSGGDVGAQSGALSVMVGGDFTAYERALPLINSFSKMVQHFGESGSGQHTKMANQIAIAAGMLGVAESLYYAKRAGLNTEKVLKTISGGAAASWSLSNLAPRMLKEDYQPGFYTHHFLKDMKIALEEAEKMAIQLPGLQLAYDMYNELSDELKQTTGTHIIYKQYNN